MRKRMCFVLLVVLCFLFVLMIPQTQAASVVASGTCGSNLTWSLNDAGTLTISGHGAMTNWTSSTLMPWYSKRSSIERIVIGSGVTSIGDCAFGGCNYITSVSIPYGVTYIGNSAFSGGDFSSITLPSTVTYIGSRAFALCDQLTYITIPDGIAAIQDSTFMSCSSLGGITIPSSVTSIGWSAFSNCYSLSEVNYGGSKTQWSSISIGYNNDYLKNSTITTAAPVRISVKTPPSKTVYQIGELLDTAGLVITATYSDGSTEEITSGFTVSGFYPSYIGVQNVTVTYQYRTTSFAVSIEACGTCGESLTWLLGADGTLTVSGTGPMTDFSFCGSPWFEYAQSIKKVVIESGVTSIGTEAFAPGFDNLTTAVLGDSVTTINDHAFDACIALTSVNIPSSVTYIGDFAFQTCGLTAIYIPENVSYIGECAFDDCRALAGIHVSEDNLHFSSDAHGVLFSKDKTQLITAPCKLTGTYRIPDEVESIRSYAFNFSNLSNIVISKNVISISNSSFNNCEDLAGYWVDEQNKVYSSDESGVLFNKTKTRIILTPARISGHYCIPDGVTSIGDYVFQGCKGLTSISIPNSVTSIGIYAFSFCSGLQNVSIGNGVTDVGTYAFYKCYEIKHIAYCGNREQWGAINIGSGTTELTNASVRHYEVTEEVHYYKNCINSGIFCTLCDLFVTKENAVSGTHTYQSDIDLCCDVCDYVRSVKKITINVLPKQQEIPLLIGEVDTTDGSITVTYSDGTVAVLAMTPDMVSGFDNRVYGQQTLTVTYSGHTATYVVKTVATSTPDKLEILTGPEQTSYLTNQEISLSGLTLRATYGDVEIELTSTDVSMDAVDMTTAGINTVTVRFNDVIATFPIYVHGKQLVTVNSSLYPESQHNYASYTNETKTFTYPGSDSLTLTFSSQSYTETNYDFVYILDGAGNQIGKYSGSLSGKVVIVPGDTVQIKLTSDSSVNQYGYAFSSIKAETILHPGEGICSLCGEFTAKAGEVAKLTQDMDLHSFTIPTDVVLDLNGYILTVNSLASFGQIIDSVGGGGLVVTNLEITENDWLPIQDSTGCYRFYEYEVVNLGTKTGADSAIFGFALDFADATAYTALLESDDVQLTVTLAVGENSQTYAFSKELVAKYVDWVAKYSELRPYMKLNVTGIDSLADGTALTVTPAITAVGGKVNSIGKGMQYIA